MIITVLWEDQRGTQVKGFGPHELLLACVADDLKLKRDDLQKLIKPNPKKGHQNILGAFTR